MENEIEYIKDEQRGKVPPLLKIVCYYIIIKAGIKSLTALIILIGGKAMAGIAGIEGFDIVEAGGPGFQAVLLLSGLLTVWAGWKILQLQRIGFYVLVAVSVLTFFAPMFFSPTYKLSLLSLILKAIPVVIVLRYLSRMK